MISSLSPILRFLAFLAFAASVRAEELPRVPPTAPADAMATFKVADGFRIEQLAAEPMVVDPVAMAFDEWGRLYVVEMCDYSEQDQERQEDADAARRGLPVAHA